MKRALVFLGLMGSLVLAVNAQGNTLCGIIENKEVEMKEKDTRVDQFEDREWLAKYLVLRVKKDDRVKLFCFNFLDNKVERDDFLSQGKEVGESLAYSWIFPVTVKENKGEFWQLMSHQHDHLAPSFLVQKVPSLPFSLQRSVLGSFKMAKSNVRPTQLVAQEKRFINGIEFTLQIQFDPIH